MPDREHYEGASLAESLRILADHHFETATRHISRHEYDLLKRAAYLLEARGADENPPDLTAET